MAESGTSERTLSLADAIGLFRRRAGTILITAGLVCLAVLFVAAQMRPRFEATATLILNTQSPSGILGDFSALSSLSGGLAASGEIEAVRARSVAERTVRAPDGAFPPRPDGAGYDRHIGLSTLVHDESLTPVALLFHRPAEAERAPVQPPHRLFARMERTASESPEKVRVEFLAADEVRVSIAGLFADLRLTDREPETFAFRPDEPIEYRGLVLHLAAEGDVVGRSFVVEHVPAYEAVERLLESYWVAETTLNSGVLQVTVEDTDPYRVAAVANAICANYLDLVRDRNERRSSRTIDYIEGLLEDSRRAIEESEEELFRIRTEHPDVVSVDATAEALIDRLKRLEIARTDIALREHSMRAILGDFEEGDVLALARLDSAVTRGLVVDPITEGYLKRLGVLNATLGELLQRYSADHPSVVENRGAADELYGLVREQLLGRLSGLSDQRLEVGRSLDDLGRELSALPADMQTVARPMLTLEIHTALVPTLLQSLHQAEIADAAAQLDADVLDPARPAVEVASPRPAPTLAIGLALGLALGFFFALVREPVTGRIARGADLAELVAAPLLGELPRGGRAPLPILDAPDSSAAEAMRSLRAALQHAAAEARAIGVTAAVAGEGTTATSAGLGAAFALAGRRVLLVDARLREPAAHALFDKKPGPGLAECLDAGKDWRDLVQASGVAGLDLIAAGAAQKAPGDLTSGPRFAECVAEWRAEYDLVVLDLPHALGSSDLDGIAPNVDGLVFQCRSGGAPRRDVQAAVDRVRRAGGRIVGGVLQG